MCRIDRGIRRPPVPRHNRLDLTLNARVKEDLRGQSSCRSAAENALRRLWRNEGPICRELESRRDMENASNGMGLRLLESLIGSESHDGQSKGINGKLVVLYVLPEDVSDAGGPTLPFQLGVVRRIAEHFHEFNPS